MNLRAGEHVDGYTVLDKLGQGGMSEVYHARDEAHGREVVLKFPHEDMIGDPSTYERFQREIKIGKALTHPHIQKLYELGGKPLAPYLVLEYVDGCTLRQLLHREEQLSPERTVALGIQLGQALAYAHDHHVFHRDLKPENIIVNANGQAKVMDFGIAFVQGARRITWGSLSSQVGTPDYMAPEQIKGSRGDQRTDIYALGMMLYECVAGRLPYRGDNALSIMNQHVTVSPPPVQRFSHAVPPVLDEVIMKAIRRDPQQRWQGMHALVDALEHLDVVDVAALQAEREQQETRTSPADVGNNHLLSLPMWQVALLIIAVFLGIIALGVIGQLVHQ